MCSSIIMLNFDLHDHMTEPQLFVHHVYGLLSVELPLASLYHLCMYCVVYRLIIAHYCLRSIVNTLSSYT